MMRRRGRWAWAALGGVATLVAGIACWFAVTGPDPWPARGSIPMDGSFLGFSADGRRAWTGYAAPMTEWDVATGAEVRTLDGRPLRKRFPSADGRRFVGWEGDYMTASSAVVVRDDATGAVARRFPVPGQQGFELAFRADDRQVEVALLVSLPAMAVVTWDLATGVESRRMVNGPGPGFSWPVAHAADGRTWAYLDFTRDAIQLWDAINDRPLGPALRTATTRRDVMTRWVAAAFAPDGRTLVAAHGDGQAEVWDVATGRLIRLLPLHGGKVAVGRLLVAPDGRTLAATGSTPTPPSWAATAWDRVYNHFTGRHPATPGLEAVAADLATGRVLARRRGCWAVALSPDGRTLVTQDHGGETYDFRPIPPVSPGEAP